MWMSKPTSVSEVCTAMDGMEGKMTRGRMCRGVVRFPEEKRSNGILLYKM